jgi:phenylacetate-CoA ligase
MGESRALYTRDRLFRAAEGYASLLAHVPAPLRIGRGYRGMKSVIRQSEAWSEDETTAWLLPRLQRLLVHVVTEVPFYRWFYERARYDVRSLRTLDDWSEVPVVTKQDLQNHALEHRCAKGVVGNPANTGGTSGTPLAFMLEASATTVEWAHMHHIWAAHGYHISQMKLRIGGTYFPHDAPFAYHPRHNEYIVNANCPMPEVAQAVLALSASRPFRWVHGYPSLVAEFAREVAQYGGPLAHRFVAHLRGALLGSEFPVPVYRDSIAAHLTSNIVSWYGHSEMALLARETAEGTYQSLPTYGYAEALACADSQGERLVCTALHNRVHPFIRYDTGDRVSPVSRQAGSLAFRIQEGRVGDFVQDRSGRKLSLTSIIFGRHHSAFNELHHLQVRQTTPGHVTLLVVPEAKAVDVGSLAMGFDFAGLDLTFDVQVVDKPVRTAAGKLKLKVDI